MIYVFAESTGRYRDTATGRFVSRGAVIQETFMEEARLKTRLQGHTRLLTSGKIDLAEWQMRCAQSIKESHIRMSALGSGGIDRLGNAQYGFIGGLLRKEYGYLDRFARQIKDGGLSEKYILARIGLYAASTRKSFYKGEQISRVIAGVTLGKRMLDGQARHCRDCPNYATAEWTPIENLVMPGEACACGGRCRCTVIYKSGERTTINLSDRLEAIVEED